MDRTPQGTLTCVLTGEIHPASQCGGEDRPGSYATILPMTRRRTVTCTYFTWGPTAPPCLLEARLLSSVSSVRAVRPLASSRPAAAVDTDVAPAAPPPPLRLRLAPLVARATAAAASARSVLRHPQRPRHRPHRRRVGKGGGRRGRIKVAVASPPPVLVASLAAAVAAAHVSAEVAGRRRGRHRVLWRARRCVLRQRNLGCEAFRLSPCSSSSTKLYNRELYK